MRWFRLPTGRAEVRVLRIEVWNPEGENVVRDLLPGSEMTIERIVPLRGPHVGGEAVVRMRLFNRGDRLEVR